MPVSNTVEQPAHIGPVPAVQFSNTKSLEPTRTVKSGNELTDPEPKVTYIVRSASFPHLASQKISDETTVESGNTTIEQLPSETLLARPANIAQNKPSLKDLVGGLYGSEEHRGLQRRKSTHAAKTSRLPISRSRGSSRWSTDGSAPTTNAAGEGGTPERNGSVRSVSSSLSTFARKSWIMSSRSPSPIKKPIDGIEFAGSRSRDLRSRSPSTSKREPQKCNTDSVMNGHAHVVQRKPTSSKKAKRPLSSLLGKSVPSIDRSSPAVPPIPKSFSTDTLPLPHQGPFSEKRPILPITTSVEQLLRAGLEPTRKKDELWSQFRTLDGEFQKFHSKTSVLKINAIRGTLLPFLRTHSAHPPSKSLRAEDLDRRVNILNKWWAGLMEMLKGRNGQSISGNDRPVILEGITEIMIRPEWRMPLSSIAARRAKSPYLSETPGSSLESMSSDFLTESVLHNVSNMFIENLLAQMAFVVDKMSMRNVAASVVSFCGRAIAYAFIFCPGIAEILVRLWSLSSETIRRVLNEVDIFRTTNLKSSAEGAASTFPTHLRPLAFESLPSLMKHLRRSPGLHPSSTSIPWHGPWVGRWTGRDSDLFFIFTKHFHLLTCGFLATETNKRERACAPCYVLVQAQMLTVLDDTIRRSIGPSLPEAPGGPSSITFDDVLEADASATAVHFPPSTTIRSMAQNRAIMLLREFLSESPLIMQSTQNIFAESFTDLLKAAARRISRFDHNACFTLCDFMEEAITILARYEQCSEKCVWFLDWSFWLETCKEMMKSDNSMTEVRLYAFIYSLWGVLTSDENRKRDVCLHWLLESEHFNRQFNHWSPMVRAYFMRLLCWRIARFDGETSEMDFAILDTLSARLKTIWCHFIYMEESETNISPPKHPQSTAPCAPAPGRRFLIIRNDVQPSSGGVFTSFDSIVPVSSSNQATAYQGHSSLDSLSQTTPQDNSSRSSSAGKKGWGLLKYVIPFAATPAERSRSPLSGNDGRAITRSASPGSKKTSDNAILAKANPQSAVHEQHRNGLRPSERKYHAQSFKFSLEWIDRYAGAPKDRRLYPPRLPLPAQMFLQSKRAEPHDFKALQPIGADLSSSKYTGRALAEWALLVVECQNFFQRRKSEGIPGNRWVETPTLGVESIRRPG